MFHKVLPKLLIVAGLFLTFTLVFTLMQNNYIYSSTLGKMSNNYENTTINGTTVINVVSKPFMQVNESKAYNWDVSYYKGIRDNMYKGTGDSAAFRYAFYPLFPMVWKATHTGIKGMVLLNYLFFGISMIFLTSVFLGNSKSEMFFFVLALILPSAIAFCLPYTEALFMLTFCVAFMGLLNRKYWLYFIAITCFSMTRPAALILSMAMVSVNMINLFSHKKFLLFIKESLLMVIPIFLGWFLVLLIQHSYSNSWGSYFEAAASWPKQRDPYYPVSDWSIEGFGMTAFAMFFFALPVSIYSIFLGCSAMLGKVKSEAISVFSGDKDYVKKFMVNASICFIAVFVLFNYVSSGYQMNGFYRYTMATPFFYIILFHLPEKLKSIPSQYKLAGFIIVLISLAIFLSSAEYGGNILRFNYMGFYLLLLLGALFLIGPHIGDRVKIVLLVIFILPCIVWHTYLFNIYLSNTWIFT
jgi:hypothetical protein